MSDSKSVILTGASRGIGFAIARYLLKGGHKLFLVARSVEPLEKLKEEFKGQVEFLGADLKDFEVSAFFSVDRAVVECWHSRMRGHVLGVDSVLESRAAGLLHQLCYNWIIKVIDLSI